MYQPSLFQFSDTAVIQAANGIPWMREPGAIYVLW